MLQATTINERGFGRNFEEFLWRFLSSWVKGQKLPADDELRDDDDGRVRPKQGKESAMRRVGRGNF